MNVMVTGGAGFIGSHLVRERRRSCPRDAIVVLDLLTYAGSRAAIADVPDVHFVAGDVRDAELVRGLLTAHSIDAIVHLAAESHVDRSIAEPLDFVSTNVLGTATLLAAARERGVRRFVHVSTDEVYGELRPGAEPWTTRARLAPNSPYAASKAAADHLIGAWRHTWGYAATIVRCVNNFGPQQHREKLIPLALSRALSDAPIPLYGDGLQKRDWLYVEDFARGLCAALDRGEPGAIYHFPGTGERTNRETITALLAALGKPAHPIRSVTDRPGHDRRYALDDCGTTAALGLGPRTHFDVALARTVAWYRDALGAWGATRPDLL